MLHHLTSQLRVGSLRSNPTLPVRPLPMYECGGCGKNFKTTGWLTRHQNQCKGHRELLEAGARKFRKVHGPPETPRSLLSRFNLLISGHGIAKSSRERSAEVSNLIHLKIETSLTGRLTEHKWHSTWGRPQRRRYDVGSRCSHAPDTT